MESTISKNSFLSSKENIKFSGPGKSSFSSLQELGASSLATYCPHWNNLDIPVSYVIPAVFKFKNPDVSDEVIKNLKNQAGTLRRPVESVVQDRIAEDAEFIVYNALTALSKEQEFGPFLAIRSLHLKLELRPDGTLKGQLVRLFPNFSWDNFQLMVRDAKCDGGKSGNCEFDFFIIGRKIGIIAIEVKGMNFSKRETFPEHYMKGIGQVNAADALTYFLHEATGVQMPHSVRVSKMLVCPCLEKERFEDLKSTLTEEERARAEKIELQFFKEDMENSMDEPEKPLFYSTLRKVFQDNISYQSKNLLISGMDSLHEWYTSYGIVSASISSIAVLEIEKKRKPAKDNSPQQGANYLQQLSQSNEHSRIRREKRKAAHFSQHLALSSESSRIAGQNPLDGELSPKRGKKGSPHSLLKAASDFPENTAGFKDLEILYLSPDQLTVMRGSNGQFIVGAAGTGKTILLQAKALESLQNGATVTVLAPKYNLPRWDAIFSKYNPNDYTVCDFQWYIAAFDDLLDYPWLEKSVRNALADQEYHTRSESKRFDWLCEYLGFTSNAQLHIFIDDPFNDESVDGNQVFLIALFLMTISQRVSPNNVVWLACDPNQVGSGTYARQWFYDPKSERIRKLLNRAIELGICSVSVLNRVMRCGKAVFDSAYHDMPWPRPNFDILPLKDFTPILGHQIIGLQTISFADKCLIYDDALQLFAGKVAAYIAQLTGGMDLTNVAVILTGSWFTINENHARDVAASLKNVLPFYEILKLSESNFGKRNTIEVAKWSEVHSLEWPLVIHACFQVSGMESYPLDANYLGKKFEIYLAKSRATAALIDIVLEIDHQAE